MRGWIVSLLVMVHSLGSGRLLSGLSNGDMNSFHSRPVVIGAARWGTVKERSIAVFT